MDEALTLTREDLLTIAEWADFVESSTGLTPREVELRERLRRFPAPKKANL